MLGNHVCLSNYTGQKTTRVVLYFPATLQQRDSGWEKTALYDMSTGPLARDFLGPRAASGTCAGGWTEGSNSQLCGRERIFATPQALAELAARRKRQRLR